MSDYSKAIEQTKLMPRFYLGQEVETPIGKGIIVHIQMEWNGLYIQPERSGAVIWFSTSCSKNGWVSKEFKLSDLKTNLKSERRNKLQKLNEI